MGFLDGLFGRGDQREQQRAPVAEDQRAIERYRYLLRTAPPETIEQVHAEAFARLTPEQRQTALRDLSQYVPEREQASSDDPRSLARAATRAEMRQPGTLERAFGGGFGGGGMGFGGSFASSLLGTVAGYAIASTIANQFFDHGDAYAAGSDADQGGWGTNDAGNDGGDGGGSGDFDAGGDFGGDFGGDVF